MADHMCATCGAFVSDTAAYWGENSSRGPHMIAPVCPGCGELIQSAARQQDGESLMQYAIVDLEKVANNAGLVAVANTKAAIMALTHWKDDPAFRAWLAQPPKQSVLSATPYEFERVLQSVSPDRRLLIRLFAEPDAPLVMVWLMPMRRQDAPPALKSLRYFS